MDRLLFLNLVSGGETEQRFLVSSASVQITASPLSWLADEDRINQAVQVLRLDGAIDSFIQQKVSDQFKERWMFVV